MNARWEVKWSECDGFDYVRGEAFGHQMTIEVYPSGESFRWRLEILNQATFGTSDTREGARADATQTAGRWLLNQSLASEFLAPSPGMRPGLAR